MEINLCVTGNTLVPVSITNIKRWEITKLAITRLSSFILINTHNDSQLYAFGVFVVNDQ
jgi:hypothetical protein